MSQGNNGNGNGNNGNGNNSSNGKKGSIISVQIDVEEGKKKVEKLVEKAREKGEAVVKKAKRKLERKNKCAEDISMEDFRFLVDSMDKKEVAKLVLWGAKNATDPETKEWCRKVLAKSAGLGAVVGGLAAWLLS